MRVDEGRKMKARTVAGRGEKSLLWDPGSEIRVGRRERRRYAKVINGMRKKKKMPEKSSLYAIYMPGNGVVLVSRFN